MTYRYAVVEDALASIHEVPAEGRAAFRARIKYFRRIGMAASTPGKGARVEYDVHQVMMLAYCFELAEFGIDPSRIELIVQWTAGDVFDILSEREKAGTFFFAATPKMIAQAAEVAEHQHNRAGLFNPTAGNPGGLVYREADLDVAALRRAIIINLSALRLDVLTALRQVQASGNLG